MKGLMPSGTPNKMASKGKEEDSKTLDNEGHALDT